MPSLLLAFTMGQNAKAFCDYRLRQLGGLAMQRIRLTRNCCWRQRH